MSCGTDLTAKHGETFVQDLLYTDSLGVPVDISVNFIVTWTVHGVAYASNTDPEVVIGPGTGEIHLMLATQDVDDITLRVVNYMVLLTDTSVGPGLGDKILLEGLLEVE